jgi:serine/threonine protein kinase
MEAQQHYSSFRRELVQATDHYKMYRCQFTRPHPNLPLRAWLKVYPSPSEEAFKEVTMLMAFAKYEECFPVVRYLYHLSCKREVYIFEELFDRILEVEIRNRSKQQQYWRESELWTYLKDLARALFQLHAIRVVHRNITPDTVFLKADKLVLGHFEDSKQIMMGQSMQMQSIRGTQLYQTPEGVRALRSGQQTLYQASLKDDIWSLGRLFLDMASLRCNSEILQLYSSPQSALNAYISSKISPRYSSAFESILCQMMTLDDSRRPAADDILSLLQEVDIGQPCEGCHNRHVLQPFSCGHRYCDSCLMQLLTERIDGQKGLECHCGGMIMLEELGTYSENCKKLGDLLEHPEVNCPANCGARYSRIKQAPKQTPTSFLCACPCGLHFCSYCGKTQGHKLLGISRVCPSLPSFH